MREGWPASLPYVPRRYFSDNPGCERASDGFAPGRTLLWERRLRDGQTREVCMQAHVGLAGWDRAPRRGCVCRQHT
jgi:hypothetical protein